jgi:LacI family transcriptional regulator
VPTANDFNTSSLVTIRDVAARAGVSVATASRALSGNRAVSASNLRTVTKAADALGYRPNRIASALRRQVSDTIGLVVPQISNPFFPILIEAVHTQLQTSPKQLLLCDSMQDSVVEQQRLQALLDHKVDGILISPCDADQSLSAVRATAARVPLVQVDRRIPGELSDWVGVDDTIGMQLVVEHILAIGARRAIFVGAEPSSASSALLRLTSFTDAAARGGLDVLPPLLGDFTTAWGIEAAQRMLAAGDLPDAAVCANDVIALGLLRVLVRAGVSVPGDLLLTGFDDIGAAELSSPSLTTVRQPFDMLAREALRLLTERAEQPDSPGQRIAVSPELVVRESTTPESEAKH